MNDSILLLLFTIPQSNGCSGSSKWMKTSTPTIIDDKLPCHVSAKKAEFLSAGSCSSGMNENKLVSSHQQWCNESHLGSFVLFLRHGYLDDAWIRLTHALYARAGFLPWSLLGYSLKGRVRPLEESAWARLSPLADVRTAFCAILFVLKCRFTFVCPPPWIRSPLFVFLLIPNSRMKLTVSCNSSSEKMTGLWFCHFGRRCVAASAFISLIVRDWHSLAVISR